MRAVPPGLETREASSADSPAITALIDAGIAGYEAFAPDEWLAPETPGRVRRAIGRRFDEDAWGLLAFEGDELVGLVSLATTVRAASGEAPPGTGYLWQMFVEPRWQGRGLASALLDRALEEAGRRGWGRLILWTPAGQRQARRFYEREGFLLSGRKQFNEEIGLDLVQYERAVA